MKKLLDDFYPTIGFDIKAEMKEQDGKWYFEVKTHVKGPNDVITKKSQMYDSKKTCLFNFISSLPDFIQPYLILFNKL